MYTCRAPHLGLIVPRGIGQGLQTFLVTGGWEGGALLWARDSANILQCTGGSHHAYQPRVPTGLCSGNPRRPNCSCQVGVTTFISKRKKLRGD